MKNGVTIIARALVSFIVAASVWSCDSYSSEDSSGFAEYTFGCSNGGRDTRSEYFKDEAEVKNYCLFFYINDKLKYSFYSSDGECLKVQFLETDEDTEMKVYALANVGNIIKNYEIGSDLDKLLCYKQSFASLSSLDGIPASYSPSSTIIPSKDLEGKVTVLPAIPMMAKFNIDVTVNNAEYPGNLEIKSVKCYNINKEVSAFGSGDKATNVVVDGDCLSASSDIPGIQKGNSASFYVPENMQGTMSNPGNDYRLKKSSNGLCTYAVVDAEYSSDMAVYGLEYVFYLGEDLYTSFNIERNKEYDLHLSLNLSDPYLFAHEAAVREVINPEQGPYIERLEEVRYRLVAYYEGEPATVIGCNTNDELSLSFKAVGDLYKDGVLQEPGYKEVDLSWDDINWDNEGEWNILQLSDYTGHERLIVNFEGDERCIISADFKGFDIEGNFEVRASDGSVTAAAMESETDLRVEVYNYYKHRPVSIDVEVDVTLTGRADKTSDFDEIYMQPQYDTTTFAWSGNVLVNANSTAHAIDMEGKISELSHLITSKYIICDSDSNGDELADYGGWAVFFRFYTVEVKVKATSSEAALNIKCESAFRQIHNESYWTPMTVGVNTVYDDPDPSTWPTLIPRF